MNFETTTGSIDPTKETKLNKDYTKTKKEA